jgi:hypothetical protein
MTTREAVKKQAPGPFGEQLGHENLPQFQLSSSNAQISKDRHRRRFGDAAGAGEGW